jgi:hypothetical protein
MRTSVRDNSHLLSCFADRVFLCALIACCRSFCCRTGAASQRENWPRAWKSERTILRDMEALSGSGVSVTAQQGKGGGWLLLNDYQTKLTGLSPAEIQSLFLARPTRLMAVSGSSVSRKRR